MIFMALAQIFCGRITLTKLLMAAAWAQALPALSARRETPHDL